MLKFISAVYFHAIYRQRLEFSAHKRLDRGLDDVQVFPPSSILHLADREMREAVAMPSTSLEKKQHAHVHVGRH